MIDLTNVVMRHYKYEIDELTIVIPGREPVKLTGDRVLAMFISKDYDNYWFPLFEIKITLDPENLYTIRQNLNTVRFKFKLKIFSTLPGEEKYPMKLDYINQTFAPLSDDTTANFDATLFQRSKKVRKQDTLTPEDLNHVESFFLYREDFLLTANKHVNTVISSGSLTDAIALCFTRTGMKDVLMTPLHNNASFSELRVLPMTLAGELDYLESQYNGFYNTGSIKFFDFDRFYLIDKSINCTAFEVNEYKETNLILTPSMTDNMLKPGSYVDGEQKCFIVNILDNAIKQSAPSIVNDPLTGTNVIYVNKTDGTATKVMSGIEQVRGGTGSNVIVMDQFGNNNQQKANLQNIKELTNVTTIEIENMDLRAFTPNKVFNIVSLSAEHRHLNGKYRLSGYDITFVKQGDIFIPRGTFLFKKS